MQNSIAHGLRANSHGADPAFHSSDSEIPNLTDDDSSSDNEMLDLPDSDSSSEWEEDNATAKPMFDSSRNEMLTSSGAEDCDSSDNERANKVDDGSCRGGEGGGEMSTDMGAMSANVGGTVAPSGRPCNSFVSGQSGGSRNPQGRPSAHDVRGALGAVSASHVLDFVCPRRMHSGLCAGVHMSVQMQQANRFEKDRRILDIAQLRDSLQKDAKGSSMTQAIANYMVAATPQSDCRLPPKDMPWMVGSRRVCDYCWCAAAGSIMDDRSGEGITRKKASFQAARQAYYKQMPTAVTERLREEHGCSGACMQCSYPGVVLVGRSRNGEPTNRVAHAKEHAECWLHTFCDPESGNVQHRTDDEKDHIQGWCGLDLYKEYKAQHEGCAGKRSTFYAAIAAAKKDKLCDIRFDKWNAQAECAECLALKVLKARARTPDIQEFHQQELDLHNHIARSERLAYGCNISVGCSMPFGNRIWSLAGDAISTHTTSGPSCHAKPLRDLKGAGHARVAYA